MAGKIITDFIKMQLFKKGGAIASDKAVKFSADALETRLKNLGIDPNALNNQTELKQLLAYVKQMEDQQFNQLYGNVLSGEDAAKFLNKAFPKKGEVIPFPQKRSFKEEVEAMKKSGDLVDEKDMVISEKITEREMFKEANDRLKSKNKVDIIADTVSRITSMEPVEALKEANKVIGRKGVYKNLDETQSKKILQDSEDWIFQRDLSDRWDYKNNRPFRDDPDFDPDDPDYLQRMKDEDAPDFAKGGRAGFYDGGYGKDAAKYIKEIETDMHKGYQYYKRHGGKKSFMDYVKSGMNKYFADGGRAGYYGGGLTEIEPNLSDIGHGSDALMARTRLLSPNNMATTSTGLNYLLAEDNDNLRVPYRYGRSVEKNPMKKAKERERKENIFKQILMMRAMPMFGEPINFPYKSLEDIPPEVLEMLKKDPNFDLETFLTKVGWSDPDKTRIQEKLRGRDEAWGLYSPISDTSFLNYQQFGKSEPIGDGILSIKSPTDADKVQTILHEMRHAKMKEPWFMQSSAVPEWVRKYEEAGGPHYLDADIQDEFAKYRGDQQDVSGEELYVRFMDQHFGDVAESGTLAGSDYKPYFDKILYDHWRPYAKRYEEILGEEKRVKDRVEGGAYGLAEGGRIGFAGGTDLRRRAFLKLMAALTGGVAAVKSGILGLSGKGSAVKKTVPLIKTDPVPGKPEWFDTLVTKIIKEGDDVTKTMQTKERQIVHKKKLNDDETAMVTQDLDEGSITVELESPKNVYGDKVQLRYIKPNPDESNPRPTAEFDVAESGPVGRADGPDDYSIEIDEIGGTNIKDLDSDVSILKEYATGQKPTMKEILQNMKRKDKAARISEGGEGEMDAVIRRQGEYIENDLVDLDPPEYAEGGRIGKWMGGGFTAGKRTLSELLKYMSREGSHGKKPSEILQMINSKQFNKILNDPAIIGKSSPEHPEGIASLVKDYIKQMQGERVTMLDDLIGTGQKIKAADDKIDSHRTFIINDMVSKGMDRDTAKDMAEVFLKMSIQAAGKKPSPKITEQGLLEMENMKKNLLTKDRKVNANGGLQTMLGE